MTSFADLISEYDMSMMLGSMDDATLDSMKFLGKDPKDLLIAIKALEADPVQRMKDMAFIVSLVQMRGASLSKIQERTGDKGKRTLMALVQKYKIAPHVKTVPMKIPTLPRIASLFPEMASGFRKKFPHLVQPLGTRGLVPEELMFPGGGSLVTEESMTIWLQWYESFCKVVGIVYDEASASLGNRFSVVPAGKRIDLT